MIYDLIIVGGGPAGVTAGIYASRQRLKCLLITKDFGGQLSRKTVAIENYPGFKKISGPELVKNLETHLRNQEIDIEKDLVSRIEKGFSVKTKKGKIFKSKTVLICSGSDPRPLEVPGEKRFIGKGVSYCALCDGPMFRDKRIAIIGGGDSGFETAIFLANYVEKMYIMERGPKVLADNINQEIVGKTDKAEIITNAVLKKIKGDNFVSLIDYQVKGENKTLKVEGVFVEIGYQPATYFANDLVDFNKKDEIKINRDTNETKTPGLFAAGDVTEIKNKQIVIAAGEGAKAALAIYNDLQRRK